MFTMIFVSLITLAIGLAAAYVTMNAALQLVHMASQARIPVTASNVVLLPAASSQTRRRAA